MSYPPCFLIAQSRWNDSAGTAFYTEELHIDRLGRNYDEILEQWRLLTKEKRPAPSGIGRCDHAYRELGSSPMAIFMAVLFRYMS